jgi:hypothetical protein
MYEPRVYLIGRVSESEALVGGRDVHGEGARVCVHPNLKDGDLEETGRRR